MNFSFKIEKSNLALNMVESKIIARDFANFLWENYQEDYKRIKNHQIFYGEDCSNLPIIQEVMKHKSFNEQLKKAEENSKRIEQNLNEFKQEIEEILTKQCKTELPNIDLEVLIVPHGGLSVYNTNIIVWGHKNGYVDKFYDLIYLYHEALHKVFSRGDVSHCIIQELTDTKLAKHFHPELEDGYEKHAFLQELQNNMKPFFELYQGKSKEEVLKQLKTEGKQDLCEIVKKVKTDLSKLNIFEFEKIMLKHSKKIEKLNKITAVRTI